MSWSGSGLEPLPMRADTSVGANNQGASYSNGLIIGDEGSNASSGEGEHPRRSKRRRTGDRVNLAEDGEEDEDYEEEEEEEGDQDVQMENGIDGVAMHAPPVPASATAAAAAAAPVIDPNDPRIPHFKPGLPDPDDKGENDCFFEDCLTRAGGNQYFIKHLIDKHCLIRGDQGRSEGGRRKTPKYLTLCPTDWPFTHGASSSCTHCGDITTLLNVEGHRSHESPAICSFCWTYFDNRSGLICHINEGPCKSNEGFARKLTLIRHMFVTGLRNPEAAQISQASEGQRKAHAEAERVARAEKYAMEQQQHEQAQMEWRAHTQAQRAQRQQRAPTPPRSHVGGYANHRFTANGAGNNVPPAIPPPPLHPAAAPVAAMAPIPPPAPDGLVPAYQPTPQAAIDYAVPSATVEAMARSIERLSGIIGDLTAANTRLLQEVQLRDQQVSGRDQQVRSRDERIIALSAENKKLVAEVARLTERVELLEQTGGDHIAGRGGGGDMSDGGD